MGVLEFRALVFRGLGLWAFGFNTSCKGVWVASRVSINGVPDCLFDELAA